MATGDQQDFENRIVSLIPPGWFANVDPIRDAIIAGISACYAFVYSLIGYVRLQTRRATSTDGFLDLSSVDLFGGNLPRMPGEADSDFRARITANLFPPADTKAAISQSLKKLTGYTPRVMESWNPGDCGVLDGIAVSSGGPTKLLGAMYLDIDTAVTPARLADPSLVGQFFVETPLPALAAIGTAPVAALDAVASLDVWTGWLVDLGQSGLEGVNSIYQLLNAIRVCGTIAWVKIVTPPPPITN